MSSTALAPGPSFPPLPFLILLFLFSCPLFWILLIPLFWPLLYFTISSHYLTTPPSRVLRTSDPYLSLNTSTIIAHRLGSAEYPENTLSYPPPDRL